MSEEEKYTYKYYIVGARPVKVAIDAQGRDRDPYALNWKTGKFEIDWSYAEKLERNGMEVIDLDETYINDDTKTDEQKRKMAKAVFDAEVKKIRKGIKERNNSKIIKNKKKPEHKPKVHEMAS